MRSRTQLIISEVKTFCKLAQFIGKDVFENKYYESSNKFFSKSKANSRRWVVYKGYAEGSKVSPNWHAWLHHAVEKKPASPSKKTTSFVPNLTGTPYKDKPKFQEKRHKDGYQSWRP